MMVSGNAIVRMVIGDYHGRKSEREPKCHVEERTPQGPVYEG